MKTIKNSNGRDIRGVRKIHSFFQQSKSVTPSQTQTSENPVNPEQTPTLCYEDIELPPTLSPELQRVKTEKDAKNPSYVWLLNQRLVMGRRPTELLYKEEFMERNNVRICIIF